MQALSQVLEDVTPHFGAEQAATQELASRKLGAEQLVQLTAEPAQVAQPG